MESCESVNPPVPVLLFGSYLTALGTMRSLARYGIKSYCVTEQFSYVTSSRYYHRLPNNHHLLSNPAALDSYLNDFPVKSAVLMPCADHWTSAIVKLDSNLQRYKWSLPDQNIIADFVDKGRFEKLLDQIGINRPRTTILKSEEDVEQVFNQESGDWFLKPADSQSFFTRYQVKAFRVSSIADALQRYRQLTKDGFRMVLQDYIPGLASAHYFIDGFIDRYGNLRALFPRQRNRMYPVDFGDSSHMTSLARGVIAPAEETISKLLAEVGYRGIFSAEFKHDHRDNGYKLLEVNTRAWAYIGFASDCGVNVARMAYLDALEKDVDKIDSYAIGKNISFLPNDFWAYRSLTKQGKLSTFSWLKSCLRSWEVVFTLRDPMPSLVCWRDILLGRAKRLLRRS